jgi:hypothetical protein
VSFDVVNLFTSVPKSEALTLAEIALVKSKTPTPVISELCDLLRICVNQNSFLFNGRYYSQQEGLAMGSPLSPILSDIYMDNLERHLFSSKHPLTTNIWYWCRYVDDIFCVWTGSNRQLVNFLKMLNEIDTHIQFTMELEEGRALNYLDLTVKIVNQKFDFSIHRKKCYSDQTINSLSRHHHSQKLAAFHTMIHRVCSIPMTDENKQNELNTIKQIATNNGYEEKLIDRLYSRKQTFIAQKAIYHTKNKEAIQWRRIPFLGEISLKIKKFLSKANINAAFYNRFTLNNILNNTKDKIDTLQQSGVYKLNCTDCGAIYIGQTGRTFEKRIKEHRACFTNNKNHSQFAKHLLENNHTSDFTPEILHIEKKGRRLDALEELEILYFLKIDGYKILNEFVYPSRSPLLHFPRDPTSHLPHPPHTNHPPSNSD